MSWHSALGRRLGTSRWFPRLARPWFGRADLALHTASRGRLALSPKDFRVGVLETTGARSGDPRRVLLYFGCIGDGYAVAASNYGSGILPGWAFNLRAHPAATISFQNTTTAMTAREAEASERGEVWQALDAVFPGYAEYRKRVADIPLFVLTPLP